MINEWASRREGSGIEERIIAVADVVEAVVSHRPCRASMGIDAALSETARSRGTLFDPTVVDACLTGLGVALSLLYEMSKRPELVFRRGLFPRCSMAAYRRQRAW